jgi:hypothetical protein
MELKRMKKNENCFFFFTQCTKERVPHMKREKESQARKKVCGEEIFST